MNTNPTQQQVSDPGFMRLLLGGLRTRSATEPVERDRPRLGRNDRCYCGSGLKYKRCCWTKHNRGD